MVRVVEKGETIMEISRSIRKAPSTISTYLWRIKMKLGAKTTEQAAVLFDRLRREEPQAARPSSRVLGVQLRRT
jgi:DNA-binding NarL/FixJ family response regulator